MSNLSYTSHLVSNLRHEQAQGKGGLFGLKYIQNLVTRHDTNRYCENFDTWKYIHHIFMGEIHVTNNSIN